MGAESPRPVDLRSACDLGWPAAICLAVLVASFSGSAAGAEPEDALRAMTPFVLNQPGLADDSGG